MITFLLNEKEVTVDAAKEEKLLWVLREKLNLTGTKYGCGISQCGACTVLLEDNPIRACVMPIGRVEGREITTIEGLKNTPLQNAWIEEQVPQCGYCQSGQILQATALLSQNANPSREEIKSFMNSVICRCGTYLRIVKAIERAAKTS